MSKQTENIDLSKPIIDMDGNPIIDEGGKYYRLSDNPTIVIKETGEEIKNVSFLISGGKPLTYLRAIRAALMFNTPMDASGMPDKEIRSFLALKFIADTGITLTNDEKVLIRKCAKVASSPLVYARIVELLDPEYMKQKLINGVENG